MKFNQSTFLTRLMLIATILFFVTCGDDKGTEPEEPSTPTTGTVTDIDGNVYQTVTIGTQEWMAENLRVTHYRNGDPIPNVIDNVTWAGLTTGACCNYNHEESNVATYGLLYNWYAGNDSRHIAPEGWHVPTDAEWHTLVNYLGGDDVAGGKLKETGDTHWTSPNAGATNESGFTGLPGGGRVSSISMFSWIGDYAYFYSSSAFDASNGYYRELSYNDAKASWCYQPKFYGCSIRCVKD